MLSNSLRQVFQPAQRLSGVTARLIHSRPPKEDGQEIDAKSMVVRQSHEASTKSFCRCGKLLLRCGEILPGQQDKIGKAGMGELGGVKEFQLIGTGLNQGVPTGQCATGVDLRLSQKLLPGLGSGRLGTVSGQAFGKP